MARERSCKTCGVSYPLTREFYGQYKNAGSIVKFRWECRECRKEISRKWREKNRDKTNNNSALRMAREGAGGKPDPFWKGVLFEEQGGKCYYCGEEITSGQLDHKISIAKGGSSNRNNLALACTQCNAEKHAKTEDEYREWRRDRGMSTDF